MSAFNPDLLSYTTRNAATARVQGVSSSFQVAPVKEVRLSGALGYNRAKYLSFPGGPCYRAQTAAQGCVAGTQDLSGRPLVRAPRLVFNLGAQYTAPVTTDWGIDLSLRGAYSSAYVTEESEDLRSNQDRFWRLNASVRLYQVDGGFDISLVGRNLTNSYYMTSVNDRTFGGQQQYTAYLNRPREVLLQAGYRF